MKDKKNLKKEIPEKKDKSLIYTSPKIIDKLIDLLHTNLLYARGNINTFRAYPGDRERLTGFEYLILQPNFSEEGYKDFDILNVKTIINEIKHLEFSSFASNCDMTNSFVLPYINETLSQGIEKYLKDNCLEEIVYIAGQRSGNSTPGSKYSRFFAMSECDMFNIDNIDFDKIVNIVDPKSLEDNEQQLSPENDELIQNINRIIDAIVKDAAIKLKDEIKGALVDANINIHKHAYELGQLTGPSISDPYVATLSQDAINGILNVKNDDDSIHDFCLKNDDNELMTDPYAHIDKSEREDEWKKKKFKEYTDEMYDVFCKKNHDYTGNNKTNSAFDLSFDLLGPMAPVVRFLDKISRYMSFAEGKEHLVTDEKVKDTLTDLANYALLTRLKLEKDERKNNKKE